MSAFDLRRLKGAALLGIAPALACTALAACSGSSSSGNGATIDAGFDGPVFDTSSPDSPAMGEAATEAGADATNGDAGTGGEGGTLCMKIDLSNAPFVNTVGNVVGAPPPMTGGAIVPGNYAATSVTAYDPSASTMVSGESPVRSIWQVGATSVLSDTQVYNAYDASPDSPPSAEAVVVNDYTIDGSTLFSTRVCDSLSPDSGAVTGSVQYTSNGTMLQFARSVAGDAGIVEIVTYTKE